MACVLLLLLLLVMVVFICCYYSVAAAAAAVHAVVVVVAVCGCCCCCSSAFTIIYSKRCCIHASASTLHNYKNECRRYNAAKVSIDKDKIHNVRSSLDACQLATNGPLQAPNTTEYIRSYSFGRKLKTLRFPESRPISDC